MDIFIILGVGSIYIFLDTLEMVILAPDKFLFTKPCAEQDFHKTGREFGDK
ncbi:hypothetical protein NIES4074_01630 [Cylindrospermum sp. NIES-4074]|nr:hypothetical protein NIES4074_01630 [Cylindrospermum sp. NIES-4074]